MEAIFRILKGDHLSLLHICVTCSGHKKDPKTAEFALEKGYCDLFKCKGFPTNPHSFLESSNFFCKVYGCASALIE